MRAFSILVAAAAALTGCDDKGDDTAVTDGSGDGGSPTVFTPRSGIWTAESVDVDLAACGPAGIEPGWQLDLLNVSSENFDLVYGEDSLACTLDGQDFGCTDQSLSQTSDDGTAAFALTWASDGSFAAIDEMSLAIDETRSCEGPGCAVLEAAGGFAYPCELQYLVGFASEG